MTRQVFRLPTVAPYTLVRVDTDPNTESPGDIRTVEGLLSIAGALLRASPDGALPTILGPDNVTHIYLKSATESVSLDLGGGSSPANADVGSDTTSTAPSGGTLAGAAGRGLAVEDDGQLATKLSTDADNSLVFGTDDGLYVPADHDLAISTDANNAISLGTDNGLYAPTVVVDSSGNPITSAYVHHQAVAATVWTITHGLGFDPAGQLVVATNGDVLDGYGVQVLSTGASMRLSFDLAFSGTAYLS